MPLLHFLVPHLNQCHGIIFVLDILNQIIMLVCNELYKKNQAVNFFFFFAANNLKFVHDLDSVTVHNTEQCCPQVMMELSYL